MFRKTIKAGLLVSVAATGVIVSAPAFAQDDGTIIVTARRVEERLQDVPISITVYNQEQLTQRNIAVATDLGTYTPSLSVNQRFGPEKANFNIRGFNQDSSTAPTVGVYFAEVVGVRAQGGTTSGNTVGAGAFTDLANVQVLKGPQGTLFGRNTTGGAVLLTPQKPTGDLEGYLEGTYGNYDQFRLQGAINIPLAETFKVRIAGERNTRDGYMKNVSGRGPDHYNDVNYYYGRLSIVADLTPDLENYTIAHYSNSRTNGYASRITGCATPTSPENPLETVASGPQFVSPDNPLGRNPAYSGTRHLQAASCAIQLARQEARGDDLYTVESRNPGAFLNIVQWQVINTTTWRASDNITIKNIMSYGEFRERANFDLGTSNFVVPNVDTSPFFGPGFDLTRISPRLVFPGAPGVPIPPGTPLFASAGAPYQRIVLDTAGPGRYNASQSTFTEELQIQGNTPDGSLSYTLGGYLEFSRPLGFNQGRTGIFFDCDRPETITCDNPLLFGSISESSTAYRFNNHGVFAQATYNFTEQLALTVGGRYTFDKIVGTTDSTRAGLSANDTTGPLFLDPVSGRMIARACTDSLNHNRIGPRPDPAVVANPPGLDRSVCTTTLVNKSNKPTWTVNLDYKPTPDLLLYAKYSRGYRQGGLNFTNPGVESWAPEKTDNYEVGAKASFRGAVNGYINLAAFYNTLNNQQIFAALTADPINASLGVAGGNAVVNAGKSRIYGAEVDGSAALFDNSLRFDVGYTYLNTKITRAAPAADRGDGTPLGQLLVGSPFDTITPTSVIGAPFALTPKHRLTATATYTLPLEESLGRVSFGATWTYTGSYVNDYSVPASVNGIALGFTPSSHLLNLNLDWKGIAGSPIDMALFATNVTKEKFNVANTGAWNSAGVAEIILNQPRFYGVRVRYNFGR